MTQTLAKLHLTLSTSSSLLSALQNESEAFLFMKWIKYKDKNLNVLVVYVPFIDGLRAVDKVIKGVGLAGQCVALF